MFSIAWKKGHVMKSVGSLVFPNSFIWKSRWVLWWMAVKSPHLKWWEDWRHQTSLDMHTQIYRTALKQFTCTLFLCYSNACPVRCPTPLFSNLTLMKHLGWGCSRFETVVASSDQSSGQQLSKVFSNMKIIGIVSSCHAVPSTAWPGHCGRPAPFHLCGYLWKCLAGTTFLFLPFKGCCRDCYRGTPSPPCSHGWSPVGVQGLAPSSCVWRLAGGSESLRLGRRALARQSPSVFLKDEKFCRCRWFCAMVSVSPVW